MAYLLPQISPWFYFKTWLILDLYKLTLLMLPAWKQVYFGEVFGNYDAMNIHFFQVCVSLRSVQYCTSSFYTGSSSDK